jgi:L,D-transpeptidase ErfK/SrfK
MLKWNRGLSRNIVIFALTIMTLFISMSALPAVCLGESQDSFGGRVSLVIDVNKRTLSVFSNGQLFKQFPVAVGKPETPTPVGDWMVNHMDRDWGSGFGIRWIGLNVPWGKFGIHGTNKPWSIGYPLSAGCIRMFNEDVLQVYQLVQIGTPVKVVGPPHWLNIIWRHSLDLKSPSGPDVVYVQMCLKKTGYYPFYCNGWFGQLTSLAVRSFQFYNGLPVSGSVDKETYALLQKASGLVPASEPNS